MPSPIVHTTLGYILYRIFRNRVPDQFTRRFLSLPLVLIFAIGISLLPDIDSIPGVLARDFGRYHNNFTHSIISGIIIAFLLAVIVRVTLRSGFWIWFAIFTLGYSLHIIFDFFTMGQRGVMLFWPITFERYDSPVKLFYGVRWSESLLSAVHLNTLASEILFVIIAGLILLIFEREKLSAKSRKRIPDSLK